MTVEAAVFTCSICGEPSKDICVFCTKDACANHRCERCKRCSDCCECEVPLSAEEAPTVEESHAAAVEPEATPAVQAALPVPPPDSAATATEEPDIEEQLMPPEEPQQ